MNKKGFTLIELLAVIVILAIIALIATPIILSMINNARKSAAKSSAYGYIEAIDSNNGFADAGISEYTKINDETYDVSSISVRMKGKAPTSGEVTILRGKVSSATLCINGYTVTYDGKEATVGNKCSGSSTSVAYSLGQVVQYDPVDNELCTSFDLDSVKAGTSTCYKWRVITVGDDKTKSTITLQMDHNLINTVAWSPNDNTTGPTTALPSLATATAEWDDSLLLNYTYDTTAATSNYGVLTCVNGSCTITGETTPIVTGLRARMITGEEIAEITKTKEPTTAWTLASSTSGKFYFSHTGKKIGTNSGGTGDTDLSWLLENVQTYANSGASANVYGSTNQGYWTLSPISNQSTRAWRVFFDGGLGTDDGQYNSSANYRVSKSTIIGVRPVITISKSVLS